MSVEDVSVRKGVAFVIFLKQTLPSYTDTQPTIGPILHRHANSPQVSTYTLLPPNARPAPRWPLLHTIQ
jgi:hypothetical protein